MSRIRPWPPPYLTTIVSTAAAQTGTWYAITMLEETTFSTITEVANEVTVVGNIESVTFAANFTLFGAFTNFTLNTGAVAAHNSKATSA